MNLKEELKWLRDKLLRRELPQANKSNINSSETVDIEFKNNLSVDLNEKVDKFIDWYYQNMVKGNYTDIEEFHKPNDMRNFIEKMAVWYELRYPEYEINKLIPSCSQEEIEINNVMRYMDGLFDENSDVRDLNWPKFYSAKVFINSLPCDEKYLLLKPKYRSCIYIGLESGYISFDLTSNGVVRKVYGIGAYTNFEINDNELKGMHIKNVVKLLKDKKISFPAYDELEENISMFEKRFYQKEEMLNCVMYRIIERGGNRIGPRRAFLFAKEFKRNIDIPMMYGIDYSDPGLGRFLNEYIKLGGSKDLICYVGYFSKTSNNEKLDTVSIEELKKFIDTNCATKYTLLETRFHQRFVNALASQVNPEEVRKEEIKQLRLQRKLQKSKKS